MRVVRFSVVLFLSLFMFSACKPDPELGDFKASVALSPDSPQTTVIVSWKPSENAESYSIQRTCVRDGIVQLENFYEYNGPELSFVDNTCESGTEYTYVVTATAFFPGLFVRHNQSKESKPCSITTEKNPFQTLDYPKNVTVEQALDKPKTLTISWDAVDNALLYEIYMDSKKLTEVSGTKYSVEHLKDDEVFSFKIKALKGYEYSVFSAKSSGRVGKAQNLTKETSLMLTNDIKESIYSMKDELWFKCKPQKGILTFYTYSDNISSLTVFSEDGTVAATGIPLFILDMDDNYSGWDQGVQINLKNVIENFSENSMYYLRISKKDFWSFDICVE